MDGGRTYASPDSHSMSRPLSNVETMGDGRAPGRLDSFVVGCRHPSANPLLGGEERRKVISFFRHQSRRVYGRRREVRTLCEG